MRNKREFYILVQWCLEHLKNDYFPDRFGDPEYISLDAAIELIDEVLKGLEEVNTDEEKIYQGDGERGN